MFVTCVEDSRFLEGDLVGDVNVEEMGLAMLRYEVSRFVEDGGGVEDLIVVSFRV